MKKIFITAVLFITVAAQSQNIQQQLVVTENDGTIGGLFKVAVQIKGTGLTGNNTLDGATVDVQFDTTQLLIPLSTGPGAAAAFAKKIGWNPNISNATGYTRTASRYTSSNVTYIRTAPAASGVDGVSVFGWDLSTSYQTIDTITFVIKDNTVQASLSIYGATNGVTLFASEGNSDNLADFTSPTLDPTIGLSNVPLPVEITSFTAQAQGRTIELSWATKTEVNNSGFDIERQAASTVAGAPSATWTKVGSITGKGTTNTPQNYSFSDVVKEAGTYNYRLKQIDHDGNFTYSSEVTVKATLSASDYQLSQNYPNPFNPSTKFTFAMKTSEHVAVKIYNSIGQEVATLLDGVVPADEIQNVTFDGSRLASGVYFYVLRAPDRVDVKKMLLMK